MKILRSRSLFGAWVVTAGLCVGCKVKPAHDHDTGVFDVGRDVGVAKSVVPKASTVPTASTVAVAPPSASESPSIGAKKGFPVRRSKYILAGRHVAAVAVTDTHVYWTYFGREQQPMRRASLEDLYHPEDVAPPEAGPNDLRSFGRGVMYTLAHGDGDAESLGGGRVVRQTDGAGVELIAQNQFQPGFPRVFGDRVYWVVSVNDTSIMTKGSGDPRARIRFREKGGAIHTLDAVTGFASYLPTASSIVTVSLGRDRVEVHPTNGGPGREAYVGHMISDPILGPDGAIYVAAGPALFKPRDRVIRITADKSEPVEAIVGEIGDIAGDDRFLYWTSGEKILRYPYAGGEVVVLAETRRPTCLTVGSSVLVWVESYPAEFGSSMKSEISILLKPAP